MLRSKVKKFRPKTKISAQKFLAWSAVFALIGTITIFLVRAATPIQIDSSLPQVRNLRAHADDRVITVTWDEPQGAAAAGIVGYFVEYGETALGTFPYTKQTTYNAVQLQPIDNNKQYSIKVYAAHGTTVEVPTPGAHDDNSAPEKRGSGRVSQPVSTTATPVSTRVDQLRQRMTGFFDDFNTEAGPFDELKWNQAGSACGQVGTYGAFINGQQHSHNQVSTIPPPGSDEYCDRGQLATRARGVFDIAGRTDANPGEIVFDIDGAAEIEKRSIWYLDLIPTTARNSGAPVDVTAHSSIFDDEPSDPSGIRIAQDFEKIKVLYYDANKMSHDITPTFQCSPSGCNMADKVSGLSPIAEPTLSLKSIPNVRRHWIVRMTTTKITIFVDSVRVFEGPLPAEFSNTTKYQLHSTIFAYNTGKDNFNNPMTFLFHWDNFGFNGPAAPTVIHNYIEGGATGILPYLGRGTVQNSVPKGVRNTVIPIPDQIGSPVKARIMFTLAAFGPGWYDYNASHGIVINGRNYPLPHPRTMVPAPVWTTWNGNQFGNGNNPMSLYIDINPADLVRGNNQVRLNIDGHHQAVMNVHIELEYNRGSQPSFTQPKDIFGLATVNTFNMPVMPSHDKYLFIEQNLDLASADDGHGGHPEDPGTPPDTTVPTVSVTAPTANQTVSGTINVTANANDNVGVNSVSFYLDGSGTPFSIDNTSPYSASWNSASVSNGSHSIVARATDSANNTGSSSSVSFTVSNTVPDTTAPTVSIAFPTAGATVAGTVTVTANASDNVGIARVELLIDGTVRGTDTASPYSFSWDTRTYGNGNHTLQVRAFDAANNQASSAQTSVTVNNVQPRKRSDANNDGIVNIFDLSVLLANWNQSGRNQAQGDADGNGTVNIFDMSILLSEWGS